MRRSRSRGGKGEEGGGCTRKQSSFVLRKSGHSGVRNKPRFKREAKKGREADVTLSSSFLHIAVKISISKNKQSFKISIC